MAIRIYLNAQETQVVFADEISGDTIKAYPRQLRYERSPLFVDNGEYFTIVDQSDNTVIGSYKFDEILDQVGAPAGANGQAVADYLYFLGFDKGGGGGLGDITNGANVGGAPGESFFAKNGTILEFRTLQGVNGIDIFNNGQVIDIDGSAKENVVKRIFRLPGPGPDPLSFGTFGFVNEYVGTNGFVQTMTLPIAAGGDDGKVIWIKSQGSIGPVINVEASGGQTINNEAPNIFIPDNGGFKFIWSWDGGINPTWETY